MVLYRAEDAIRGVDDYHDYILVMVVGMGVWGRGKGGKWEGRIRFGMYRDDFSIDAIDVGYVDDPSEVDE